MKDITKRIDEFLAGFTAYMMNNKIGSSTGAMDIAFEREMKNVIWDPLYPKKGWRAALEKVAKENGYDKKLYKKLENYFKKYDRK